MKILANLNLLIALVLGLNSCVGPAMSDQSFEILSQGRASSSQVSDISETLTLRVPEVMRRLGVESMPRVKVILWMDGNEFAEEFGGNAINVRGFINSDKWEVHLFDTGSPLGFSALHEYVHLISLAVNPRRNEIPLWLWESIAIYESGRPPPPDPVTLSCITQNNIPTLSELNEHPSNIYRIGFLLAEFIESEWTYDAFRLLLLNRGEIPTTFNISESEFRDRWLNYVLENHRIHATAVPDSPNC